MAFSDRTLAVVIEVTADSYTHDQLDVLFLRLGLVGRGPLDQGTGRTKLRRVRRAVELLEADDRTMELVRELVEERFSRSTGATWGQSPAVPERLVDAVRLDGFDIAEGRLVAATPGPASLGPETSALELRLRERGYVVAASHYEQAVGSYVDGRREASNGQLRSFLESLLIDLSNRTTGGSPSSARGAIDRLRSSGHIDGSEADILKGVVGVSNSRGAHAGLSDDEEALFRLHFATATARYILARVQESTP